MTPRRVLIVGGGSAGWMAAAYLDAVLNRGGFRLADIGLVESPDVPRIGVGEATIPSINHVLAAIGIDELDFLRTVDGTFKQSIKFVNWLGNRGDYYYHAFTRYRTTPLDVSGSQWLQSDRSVPFMETVSAQPVLCQLGLAPRTIEPWCLGAPLTYAFHMNALKFADYLRDIATGRGVRHWLDHVVDVEVTENGHIAAVRTKAGERLEADIFVDCTGFAGLLIEQALGVGWVDCSQWLLCDRATTMHVPYELHYPGHVRPYTTATALSAGWVWEIPLQDRRSLGYVHSGAFLDDDAAERELRRFEGPHAEDLPTRIVRFKVGHRVKSWAGNCVAIGLSGQFIEPLESTGLYLSDLASVMLAEHFPSGEEMAPLAMRFNRIMGNRFYEILDFINMHYCLTRRSDTEFWREVRKRERITDRLQAKLDYWRIRPPAAADFEDQFFPGMPERPLPAGGLPGDHRTPVDTAGVFTLSSYEAVLYGMDFLADECRREYGEALPRATVLRHVAERQLLLQQRLPLHDVWLKAVAGMRDYRAAP